MESEEEVKVRGGERKERLEVKNEEGKQVERWRKG